MLNRSFGIEQLESNDPNGLDELMAYAEPLDGITTSIVAMEAYDVNYGICSHDDDFEPLSLVTLHPKENYFKHGKLEQSIHAFRTHKVGIHMNMSFGDFMKQPRHVNKMILKECELAERKEATTAAQIMAGLQGDRP